MDEEINTEKQAENGVSPPLDEDMNRHSGLLEED